jgi:hypothetical protein
MVRMRGRKWLNFRFFQHLKYLSADTRLGNYFFFVCVHEIAILPPPPAAHTKADKIDCGTNGRLVRFAEERTPSRQPQNGPGYFANFGRKAAQGDQIGRIFAQ